MNTNQLPNRLINETSPYLLQHAHNPVDWYPWGNDAFEKAKTQDKPIFLSIGYSCCHWCHVMERESFENEDIAKLLNSGFVSIKVDREERPDIDEVYMNVCQAMTGSGGWPLSIIMTPDKKPFFAGTYLPPKNMHGRTGLDSLLAQIMRLWHEERTALAEHSEKVAQVLSETGKTEGGGDAEKALKDATRALRSMYEPKYGGFSTAPKFPMPHYILFLMHEFKSHDKKDALDIAGHTLKSMARGGIYDHVGGGFSRYSTDGRWLVPYFEKMLYDNALLLRAYAEMCAITGDAVYKRIATHTAEYIMRDMQSPDGGYYSAEDADSEGEEGKFYVWGEAELAEALTIEELQCLQVRWGLTAAGNFEGKTILNRIGTTDEPDESDVALMSKLYSIRKKRVPPFKDMKVSASWNGLMIEAMARAGVALGETALTRSAEAAAQFVMAHMTDDKGLACGTYLNGPGGPAFLADWANMINGLLALFAATRSIQWLEKSRTLAEGMLRLFADESGFAMTPKGAEVLLMSPRDTYDGAMPSGNAFAVWALQRLHWLTGEDRWRKALEKALAALLPLAECSPPSHIHLLTALLGEGTPHRQIIITARPDSAEAAEVYSKIARQFEPYTTLLWYDDTQEMTDALPMLSEYRTDRPFAVYICENYQCRQPLYTLDELMKALDISPD